MHTMIFQVCFVYRSDSRGQHREADVLLRALVEAEIDGVAVANQLTALKETMDSFAKVKPALEDILLINQVDEEMRQKE